MSNKIISSSLIRHPIAWWMPFISLGITLFGILFLDWRLLPIVFFFWWEVILMLATALIRMLFAMDNKPFTAHLFQKISLLASGLVMGAVLVMLSVAFTIKAFDNFSNESLAGISPQVKLLQLCYATVLIVHFFANGRYRTASPVGEIVVVFFHLVSVLALLMIFSMFLIPKFPQLNQALWVAIALVVVKFAVDLLFGKIRHTFRDIFEGTLNKG